MRSIHGSRKRNTASITLVPLTTVEQVLLFQSVTWLPQNQGCAERPKELALVTF